MSGQRKRAILYARVSTTRQANDELPIDSQVEAGRLKAAALDADLVRVFVDPGISGRDWTRGAFQDAVAYCSAMDVDYFICWSTSRFGRGRIDAAMYKRELRRGGTQIVYIASDVDGGSDDGWLFEGFLELIDESYSRQVSKDTRRSMMKNARDGYYNGGRVPFGYAAVPDGKRKRLAVFEPEAVVVREIFSEYQGGAGVKAIALWLNESGRFRRGARWSKTAVTNLLTSWVYTGHISFNRTSHDGADRPESEWIRTPSHPAIIDQDAFTAVQDTLRLRAPASGSGSPHSTFLFTGMLRCGECGQGLQTESATGRTRVYHYYNCRGAQKGLGCRHRRIPAYDFDRWLSDVILESVVSPENLRGLAEEISGLKGRWAKERDTRRASVVTELRSATDRRGRLFDVLELHGKDAPNLGDLTTRLRALNDQIKGLEAVLAGIDAEQAPTAALDPAELDLLAEFMREVIRDTAGAKNARRVRDFYSTFVSAIAVGADSVSITYRPDRILANRPLRPVHSKKDWLPEAASVRTKTLHVALPERWVRAA